VAWASLCCSNDCESTKRQPEIMKRGHLLLAVFLACALVAAGALTYKRWPQLLKKLTEQKTATSSNKNEASSVPPFSTREPERYQATRIITSVEYQNGSADATPETVTTKMLIARDGEKRREEYIGAEATTVFLEVPTGRFLLLPAKKLYADLNLASGDLDSLDPQSDAYSEFSPERLLNETRALARYEKLGAETLDGRSTTKYRVTTADSTNGTEDGSVTLIWIDDGFGMPIRSETISGGGDHWSKLTVELRDLKPEVDPRLFDLPNDYKRADYRQLQAAIKQARDAQSVEKSEVEKR
jgi:hypothetical protein